MTISAGLRDKLRHELNVLKSTVESQEPALAAFNFVLEYDSGDSPWYDGVEESAAFIQRMIEEDSATIIAIQTLLATVDDDPPTATFTADDAREHDASKVDVQDTAKPSGKPVQRRKVVKAKTTRQTRPTLRVNVDIATLRQLAADGATYTELSKLFKISRGTVGNIVRGEGCYE